MRNKLGLNITLKMCITTGCNNIEEVKNKAKKLVIKNRGFSNAPFASAR